MPLKMSADATLFMLRRALMLSMQDTRDMPMLLSALMLRDATR